MLDQVKIINLPSINDERGVLTAVESAQDIPFSIPRLFYMHHGVEDRGGHAHIDTAQIIIPISGSFKVTLFDGKSRQSHRLDSAVRGLYVPRMIFIELSEFLENSVCLVLASDHYDIKRSLRDLDAYTHYLGRLDG